MASIDFPVSIGPFTMTSVDLSSAFNAFYIQHQFPKPDPESEENSMAGLDPARARLGMGEIIFCQISPLHKITLDSETKAAAQIPNEAAYFSWCYPMVLTSDGPRLTPGTPQCNFLTFGGYIYFNGERDVVGTNAISPAPLGTLGLMFGRSQCLPHQAADSLTRQGRFQEITLEALATKGATHFAWIRPGEFDSVACPDGCFAYKFATGGPRYFPVVSKPIFTKALVDEELGDGEAWAVVRYSQPCIEVPVIFDKAKLLEDNLADTSTDNLAIAMTADIEVTVGKDSDDSVSLSYKKWMESADQGTIGDPWIVKITPKS
eukprot:TRINITY_DN15493_c0_g3_i1.p1 TRINITY_DN15493_c0_g3~~TRINITY_DN15493_c0_g3_i1.p1  ORF type:complete len:343 (+),score=43.57 TRINITY_DN15493_c0_g3_i1:75-1031(+)